MAQPKIKTFEAACKALKLDPEKATPKVDGFPEQHAKALIAMGKLMIIIQALNGDWKPDWNNYDQPKYWIWWDLEKTEDSPSGFRLDDVTYYFAARMSAPAFASRIGRPRSGLRLRKKSGNCIRIS